MHNHPPHSLSEPVPSRLVRLACLVVISLLLSHRSAVAWEKSASIDLPFTVTSLISWDDTRIGSVDGTESAITLFTADGSVSESISIDSQWVEPSAEIFPNQVIRDRERGLLIWLNKSLGTVGIFKDSGQFLDEFPVKVDGPWWLTILPSGNLEIFGTSEHDPEAGYEEYDIAGRFVGKRPGWLEPRKNQNAFAGTIVVRSPAGLEGEFLAYFAFARLGGKVVDLIDVCGDIPEKVRQWFKDRRNTVLPKPIGPGYDPDRDPLGLLPFIVDADVHPDGRGLVALVNSGQLLFYDGQIPTCLSIRPEVPGTVSTSLASADGFLGILSRRPSDERSTVDLWSNKNTRRKSDD